MSDPDRCEWCELDYCLPPKIYTDAGWKCSYALPMEEGDFCEKCGASESDLMTEEEWEESQKVKDAMQV